MFPPCSLCLAKLNANTQKADELISAQINAFFVWDVVATSVRTKTQLHSTSTSTRAAAVRGPHRGVTRRGTRRGGQIKDEDYLKIKRVCTKRDASNSSGLQQECRLEEIKKCLHLLQL
ncbi:hypothetical protein ILYODFUR_004896 [Ilyodon furcidens]|uniref:Uncharacterized protein n=1 Tax=Ilyodon furcidens TaxID=33524 RepID=A0ABV0T5G8_9TELE